MKENKNIQPVDKLFRQALEGYKPAPPASVWKKIRSGSGNSGSPFIQFLNKYFGLLIGSAVIIGIISFWAYNNSFTPSAKIVDNLKPSNRVEQPSLNKIFIQNSTKTNNSIVVANSKIENSTIANSNLHKTKISTEKTDNKEIITKFPVQKQIDLTNNASGFKGDVPIKTTAKTAAENLIQNETITPPNEANFKPETENYREFDNSLVSDKPEISDTTSMLIPTKSSLISETSENTPITVPPAENSHDNSSGKLKYFVGTFGTLGQVLLKGLSSNDFYSGGVLAGISSSKSKMSLETGIGFSYYKNHGNYDFEFRRTDTIGYTGYTFYNSYDSSFLIIYKPTTKDSLLYKNTNPQTSYSYLRIPLYFTKQIFHIGEIDVGLKTGPSCEILVKKAETQPEYQIPGTKFIALTNNSYSMLSVNWQWLIAPQMSVGITKKIQFRLEPAANFYLNNLYDKKNRPSSKPYGVSITAGLTYQFE